MFLCNNKAAFYFLGGLLAGLIKGIALSKNGAFQDTLIYYEYYDSIVNQGAYDGIIAFSLQSSKFEPVLGLIFFLQSLLLPVLNEQYFLILNIIWLTLFLAFVFFSYIKNANFSSSKCFFLGFLPALGYLVLSKDLYLWRNIYSFCFFMLMLQSKTRKGFILFGLLSILSHVSAMLFIGIFNWFIQLK